MRIGVMGAGAVGCYIGGSLALAKAEVVLVGRGSLSADLAGGGITLVSLRGDRRTVPRESVVISTEAEALAGCDAVLCCVKSAQTAEAGAALAAAVGPDVVVVSLQNGVRNADTLRAALGERLVLGGIVGFNVVWKDGGVFQQATSGPLVLERSEHARARELASRLEAARFDVERPRDIRAKQWSKLMMNLNNAVSALSGAPTRDLVLVAGYRRILAAVIEEALAVLAAAGIRPARLGPLPPSLFPRILRLPTAVVKVVAGAQLRIDPEARSSMWQDLARRRTTEVDHLNGEIVSLAAEHGVEAPLNARLVRLVHAAEARRSGSPGFSPDELWRRLMGPTPPD